MSLSSIASRGRAAAATASLSLCMMLLGACVAVGEDRGAAASSPASVPGANTSSLRISEEYKIGAYYFGYWSHEFPADQLAHVQQMYGRKSDWWAGVRDLYAATTTHQHGLFNGDFGHLKPLIGYYDVSDPKVLEQQINQATSWGLSYFDFYWYWDATANAEKYGDGLRSFLAAGNEHEMSFMLSIVSPSSAALGMQIPQSSFEHVVEHIVSNYLGRHNYLRSPDGRPLVQIFNNTGLGKGDAASTEQFIRLLKQRASAELHLDPLVILNVTDTGLGAVKSADAITCSDWFYFPRGSAVRTMPYEDYLANIKNFYAAASAKAAGLPFLHCISSGHDERPRIYLSTAANSPEAIENLKRRLPYYTTRSPSLFAAALETAKQAMDASQDSLSRYLTIYAWNEWNEGGIIEPNVKDGSAYLQALAKVFSEPPPSRPCAQVPACNRASGLAGDVDWPSGNCEIRGWTADLDKPETSLEVGVFAKQADRAERQLLLKLPANQFRFDINARLHIIGRHGFAFDAQSLRSAGDPTSILSIDALSPAPGAAGNQEISARVLGQICH